jgi:malate synthase
MAPYGDVLTPEALDLLADIHRRFDGIRRERLQERGRRQARFDAGDLPDFRPDTAGIRQSDWRVAPIPHALQDRRVEITGPTDRKMVINALNSGAKVFMADFEDSSAPTWANQMEGQRNLRDAVDRTIEYAGPDGRHYALSPHPAVLMVRPRGLHLPERHLTVDGETVSGAFVDFALFAWHNAAVLHARDQGPYFYLPKLQSMEEAALWDDVLSHTEGALGLPHGCMKVTVLIETLPAVFEMDEILYALRSRVVGLNCGRWDYIFSYIKTLRAHRDRLLPERGQVTMTVPFLKAYADLLVRTCHRRGAFAMGGMAAQIPVRGDDKANQQALDKVRADKLREVTAGHDGTWVAHPALVPVAQAVFDEHMHGPNQLHVMREDVQVSRDMLVVPPVGTVTRSGFDNTVEVSLRYTAAWLDGLGCVPIHHLMEDAATAEIARAQLWQWLHHGPIYFSDGAPVDRALFERTLAAHVHQLERSDLPGAHRASQAAALLTELTRADTLHDFLTLPAYDHLT